MVVVVVFCWAALGSICVTDVEVLDNVWLDDELQDHKMPVRTIHIVRKKSFVFCISNDNGI